MAGDRKRAANDVSRREFTVAAGGLVALALTGCGDPSRVSVGGLLDSDEPPFDLALPPRDLTGGGGACTPRAAAGPAAAIAIGQAKQLTSGSYTFFLCRDAGGLFAVSAICSHASCVVRRQAARFYCPCHGATYDLNGQRPTAPALVPLDHYAVCLDGDGNAFVDCQIVVDPSVRT